MKNINEIKNTILCGDVLETLKQIPNESIDMVMTSPPYWALRDYGVDGQLGLERTFDEYLDKLCNVFDEIYRVLKNEGTCWVNLGDTYAGNKYGLTDPKASNYLNNNSNKLNKKKGQLGGKCLVQIPSRFAIEMCNPNWILREDLTDIEKHFVLKQLISRKIL